MINVLLTQKGWPGRKKGNQIQFAPIFILYDAVLTDQEGWLIQRCLKSEILTLDVSGFRSAPAVS